LLLNIAHKFWNCNPIPEISAQKNGADQGISTIRNFFQKVYFLTISSVYHGGRKDEKGGDFRQTSPGTPIKGGNF
jgi:hypothetical protein